MNVNKQLSTTDKTLISNYIRSMIEIYNGQFDELKDKIKILFYIIDKSDEVSLYVHNETLKCNNKIIGYTSTLILYYRTDNYWNTIPSYVVSDERDACLKEVVKNLLIQIPDKIND